MTLHNVFNVPNGLPVRKAWYNDSLVSKRPVQNASCILAILRHSSVTMPQPINLRSISHVGGLPPIRFAEQI